MIFYFKNIAAYLFIFFMFLLESGCAGVSVTSPEQVEYNLRDLLETYSDANEVRTVWSLKTIEGSQRINATPLLAAIVLENNKRVPELIQEGANTNIVTGSTFSPLGCAAYPAYCTRWILRKTGSHDWDNSLPLMELLLDNGADPNAPFHRGVHLMEPVLCKSFTINGRYLGLDKKSVKMLKLLSEHGAVYGNKMIEQCRNVVEKEAEGWVDSGSRAELKIWKRWQKKLLFLDDLEEYGLEKALNMWEKPDQYFSIAKKRREGDEAERKRLQALNERRRREKIAAIQSYINQDVFLTSALSDIAQIGAEKSTVEWILLQNRFGADECETRVDGAYFKSKACESSAKSLISQIKTHYSTLNSTYQKQRDWFTGLFGKNASFVEEIVDDRVANVGSIDEIKQQYAPAFQQLRRITETEARAERSARKRQEQRLMADFMSNIQSTFERTNRMLDRNMARTQQTINQAYASQRSSGNYADSGYQVRSNAPAMRDLDKKLEDIDRSFSTNSGTKDRPDIASSPVKPSHRVCGGPFTVPAMNKVFDIKALNSGKASPPIECSAGGSPIMEGRYNPKAQYINWLMQPPNYKKEAIRNENGRPSGRFRVSWDAFRYECLCSNRSGGQRSGSYQQ